MVMDGVECEANFHMCVCKLLLFASSGVSERQVCRTHSAWHHLDVQLASFACVARWGWGSLCMDSFSLLVV